MKIHEIQHADLPKQDNHSQEWHREHIQRGLRFTQVAKRPPVHTKARDVSKGKTSHRKKRSPEEVIGELSTQRKSPVAAVGHPYAEVVTHLLVSAEGESEVSPVQAAPWMEQVASATLLAASVVVGEEMGPMSFLMEHPKLQGSPLMGTRITVIEYSTAPLRFNIELATTPEGLPLLQAHQAELYRFFAEGEFDFGIERIDILLETQDAEPEGPAQERDQEHEERL